MFYYPSLGTQYLLSSGEAWRYVDRASFLHVISVCLLPGLARFLENKQPEKAGKHPLRPERREDMQRLQCTGQASLIAALCWSHLPQMALHLYKDIGQGFLFPCIGKEEKVIDFFASKQSSRESNCSLHISILSESRLNGKIKGNESCSPDCPVYTNSQPFFFP